MEDIYRALHSTEMQDFQRPSVECEKGKEPEHCYHYHLSYLVPKSEGGAKCPALANKSQGPRDRDIEVLDLEDENDGEGQGMHFTGEEDNGGQYGKGGRSRAAKLSK